MNKEKKHFPLYRREAHTLSYASVYGEIVLLRPLSFAFMVSASLAITTIIVGFFIWGTYTKRSTLTGQLVPDLGLIKVYVPQFGTIIEKHAAEGQSVKRGDLLYVISSDLRSSAVGNTQAMISEQVEKQRQSFRDDIEKTKSLEQSDRQAAQTKLSNLQLELTKVNELVDGMHKRVALAESVKERYESLSKQGYLSTDQLLERQTDLLDQRERLEGLERDQITLQQQISDQQTLLKELSMKYQTQIGDFERSVASTEQQLTQSEAKRRLEITAPDNGTVTAVVGEVGQTVDPSRPLLSVIPLGATLQAQLYAPSSAVGFIKPGESVYLRYAAYPYQKFGHHLGTVKSISLTAVSPSELAGVDSLVPGGGNEQVYRVTVNLDSQSVLAYGRQHALQAGMTVDADVLQDTRHLYEWVLEPLITLSGKFH